MILQKDKRLLPEIQKNGCYFMALLFCANKYAGAEWDTDKINNFYKRMVHLGFIKADDDFTTVADYDAMILLPGKILMMAGLKARYNNRHDLPHITCRNNQFEILKFKYENLTPFVCGDGFGIVTYDPWGESNTVRFGRLDSKRIFTRE
jgi:hypothetical protein